MMSYLNMSISCMILLYPDLQNKKKAVSLNVLDMSNSFSICLSQKSQCTDTMIQMKLMLMTHTNKQFFLLVCRLFIKNKYSLNFQDQRSPETLKISTIVLRRAVPNLRHFFDDCSKLHIINVFFQICGKLHQFFFNLWKLQNNPT